MSKHKKNKKKISKAKKSKSSKKKASSKKSVFKKLSALPKVSLKRKELDLKADKIIAKGKERGFITYDEILKEFPKIENDVIFLDELYNKFMTAGLDVLEGGGLLEANNDEQIKKYVYGAKSPDANYDSIQIYLKEIGQYPLISAAAEKELARKILNGDAEARNILAKANLRLVVSIAKK